MPMPPRTAERLLRWCLRSAGTADFIVGDLRQEYAALRTRRGGVAATLWYWWQALAVGVRYLGGSPEATPGSAPGTAPGGSPGTARLDGPGSSFSRDVVAELVAALRVFRSAPGFALAVVVTLALGLGANATMFGAVDRVLLSPPEHVQDHESLRFLQLDGLGQRSLNGPMAYSFPDYEAIRDLPVLEGAAVYRPRRRFTMGSGIDARRALVQGAGFEFFPLLGVQPALGRFFDADDDRAGAPPVAVLSYSFWDREFGLDPEVVGRVVTLGTHDYEVVGVAPRGFTGAEIRSVDLWVPVRMNVALENSWGPMESRGAWWFRVIVRLRDGVTDAQASARMTEAHTVAVNAAIEAGETVGPDEQGGRVRTGAFLMALGPNSTTDTSITLWLAGVSLLVLLIACANVANLMLARGIDRQRDRAVRLAFGVSRRRLILRALSEALVLTVVGGAAATLVARWSGQTLYGLLLPGIPLPDQWLDPRLFGFLAMIVLATTVVAGVLPAMQALRTDPGDVLRKNRRGSTRGGARARDLLTLGQVSLSTVLLVGAGLFVQSLQRALEFDVGFDHEVLINVELEMHGGVEWERQDQLHREALAVLGAMPGVERAILSSSQRPLYGWDEMHDMWTSNGDKIPRVPQGGPYTYAGTEGYIETAGLRVTQGRAFTASEYRTGAPQALMVSRSFAEGVWPGRDPVGECISLRVRVGETDGPGPCQPVIGVYEDIMVGSLGDQSQWSVTWPLPLETEGLRGLLLRVDGDPEAIVPALRERMASLGSDIRYVSATPQVSRIRSMRGSWRVGATLFTAFGVLALVVASLGLYSVLSFAVAQRSREIGIRAALGAQRGDLLRLIVARAARLVAAGLVGGLAIALLTGRFLEAVLLDVPTVNPTVFAAVAAALAAAALLAAWVPAWRAAAIDPAGAMSAE